MLVKIKTILSHKSFFMILSLYIAIFNGLGLFKDIYSEKSFNESFSMKHIKDIYSNDIVVKQYNIIPNNNNYNEKDLIKSIKENIVNNECDNNIENKYIEFRFDILANKSIHSIIIPFNSLFLCENIEEKKDINMEKDLYFYLSGLIVIIIIHIIIIYIFNQLDFNININKLDYLIEFEKILKTLLNSILLLISAYLIYKLNDSNETIKNLLNLSVTILNIILSNLIFIFIEINLLKLKFNFIELIEKNRLDKNLSIKQVFQKVNIKESFIDKEILIFAKNTSYLNLIYSAFIKNYVKKEIFYLIKIK